MNFFLRLWVPLETNLVCSSVIVFITFSVDSIFLEREAEQKEQDTLLFVLPSRQLELIP
jgi:hypothetical protein